MTTLYKTELAIFEKGHLEKALQEARFNHSKAARTLGINRTTFRKKLIALFGDKYIATSVL